jgi:uncharacterized membrane protein HdeD (DUF308 family)
MATNVENADMMLAEDWWALALRGVLAVIVGLIALFFPGVTLTAFVLLFAAYMLVDGIFALIAGLRAASRHERSWPLFLEAAADIVAGVIAFFWPAITLLVLVFLVSFWAIFSGVMMIAAAFRPAGRREWLLALGGLLSVIFGILVLIAPITGAVVLALWFGAYAVAFGIVLLILAFRLRRHGRRIEPVARTA